MAYYADRSQFGEQYPDIVTVASLTGSCRMCGIPLSTRMDTYCPDCTRTMQSIEAAEYEQVNPNHPEARPFDAPHNFSGNE